MLLYLTFPLGPCDFVSVAHCLPADTLAPNLQETAAKKLAPGQAHVFHTLPCRRQAAAKQNGGQQNGATWQEQPGKDLRHGGSGSLQRACFTDWKR
jgi:hypothetical protein